MQLTQKKNYAYLHINHRLLLEIHTTKVARMTISRKETQGLEEEIFTDIVWIFFVWIFFNMGLRFYLLTVKLKLQILSLSIL